MLLVVIRHSSLEGTLLHTFGWLGVDLFFVLSGYLVAGLLFKEYKEQGQMRIGRFLYRRAMKIYPSFYLFLLWSLLLDGLWYHRHYETGRLLSEVFYVQNYLPGIFTHSWSLAVEEHFYLLLAAVMFLLQHYRYFRPGRGALVVLSAIWIGAVVLRMAALKLWPESTTLLQTHVRADGILLGVLIAYLVQFTPFVEWVRPFRYGLLIPAILFLLPGFFPSGGYWIDTLGLSVVVLGFGLLLVMAVSGRSTKGSVPFWLRPLTFLGMHSYSIYLWHLKGNEWLLRFDFGSGAWMSVLYFVFSIGTGLLFSLTVERLFLRWRG